MKIYFDRGSRVKILEVNDLVLILKETALGLEQKYDGSYRIINVTTLDTYQLELVSNPTKVTIAYANKLKKYYSNDVCAANISEVNNNIEVLKEDRDIKKMSNQEILSNKNRYLSHLPEKQKLVLINFIHSNSDLFADHPSVTNIIVHDIDVGEGGAHQESLLSG